MGLFDLSFPKFMAVVLTIMILIVATLLVGIHAVVPMPTMDNELDVLQHYGYRINIAPAVPKGQTITYQWYGDAYTLPDFINVAKENNITEINWVQGHRDIWFWDDQYPALYFEDNYGVIYRYG